MDLTVYTYITSLLTGSAYSNYVLRRLLLNRK
uniref:Uncharacterized protein n=1 Tax=Anguilla anguilla TaxID=7936 RepID=A0A0E9XI44_ANGAN